MNKLWPILPAAGVGARMQADCPKQYLTLGGQYLIDHTLDCFLTYGKFQQVILVLSEQDEYWQKSRFSKDDRIIRAVGGRERSDSVLSGLESISSLAKADDWVLVHDVARPCLHHSDLDRLIDQVMDAERRSSSKSGVGGILATPVRDTMKRGRIDNQIYSIDHTVDREALWHAMTPQMFLYSELRQALQNCLEQQQPVTDEASAMEQQGWAPILVEGRPDNIKVTHPNDLALAELYLSQER